MTLTENGKNYIARTFGINNCFASSGISFVAHGTDGLDTQIDGNTSSLVAILINDSVFSSITYNGTDYYKSDLISANDGNSIDMENDITWIADNDGDPLGENLYCYTPPTITPTPTTTVTPPVTTPPPTPTTTVTPPVTTPPPTPTTVVHPPVTTPPPTHYPEATAPPLGTIEIIGPPTGAPAVDFDLTNLTMSQDKNDYHLILDNINITNLSQWDAYYIIEVKLFKDAQTECPSTGEAFDGVDRTSSFGIRTIHLGPGETASNHTADIYQPACLSGLYTVCIYLHGNWSSGDVYDEVKDIVEVTTCQ